ncbi:MAG TPA: hypothetical protein VJZ27_07950, partial [Aggregatilineales bacterium]|nr:hypothetical protein [Aggregatilineales bacterium]
EKAARQIVDDLRHAADSAYSYPDTAQNYIQAAQSIDPANKHFDSLNKYLEEVHAAVNALDTFRIRDDGSDLADWIQHSAATLRGYQNDITDSGFSAIVRMLNQILENWRQVTDMLILGRRHQPVDRLKRMSAAIEPYNSSIATWFGKTARLIGEAGNPEKFAANQKLTEDLLAGYQAWDEGQMGRAADAARRGRQNAHTENEQLAVERLQTLAEMTERWLREKGVRDPDLTDSSEKAAYGLFLPDEVREYERFTGQMPDEDVYLKSMKRGIVHYMETGSSASYRALFLHYVLRGVQEVQDDNLDHAEFWREAALNIRQIWKTHPVFVEFDGELTRHRLIQRAEEAINSIHSIDDLGSAKQVLNAPLADAWLKDAQQAVQLVQEAFVHWSDGEFRQTRDHFDAALKHLDVAQSDAEMNIEAF